MAQRLKIVFILTLQAILVSVTSGASLVRESDHTNLKVRISELDWILNDAVTAVKPPKPQHDGSGDAVFEGDILGISLRGLSQEMIAKTLLKNGIIGDNYRWSGTGEMPYYIDTTFDAQEKAVISSAILEVNQQTNVNIRPYVSTDQDYLYIRKGQPGAGCNSYVGRQSGGQYLTLEAACVPEIGGKGTVIHELMHALGFFHEQARTDRDDYVNIYTSNIIPDFVFAFEKYVSEVYNQPYDFGSIMHYRKDAFAITPDAVSIFPKAPYTHCFIGQIEGLSAIDIAKINSMYPGSSPMPARLPVGCELLWQYNVRFRLKTYLNPNKYVSSGKRFYVTYFWESGSYTAMYDTTGNTTTTSFNDSHGHDLSSISTGSYLWVRVLAYALPSLEPTGTYMVGPYKVGPGNVTLHAESNKSNGSSVSVNFESY